MHRNLTEATEEIQYEDTDFSVHSVRFLCFLRY
jgi:hypothetical protein